MTKIAIVYHSISGSTETVARHIALGAKTLTSDVKLMSCKSVDMVYLDNADAIIFGCPTYMGSVPAEFKVFMDGTSDAWLNRRWCNKLAAGFTDSSAPSGDKSGTLQQLALFAFQHGMIWVGLDIMAGKPENGSAIPLNRLGTWLGLATQISSKVKNSEFTDSDLATAEYFGKRIANITKNFKVGE